jgi:hypothetical protein
VEELSKPRQILSASLRLALRGLAAMLILAFLGGLLSFAFWSFAQWGRQQLQEGVEIEGVHVRAWGLVFPKWTDLAFDSLQVAIPASGLELLIRSTSLHLNPASWPQGTQPSVADLSVSHLRVTIDTSVHTPKDSTAIPAWPSIEIPMSLKLKIDTLDLDVGRSLRIMDVALQAKDRAHIALSLRKLSMRGLPVEASLQAKADWRTSDTVALALQGRVWGGCCSNDSFSTQASLWRKDLRRGEVDLKAWLADVSGWSDLVPALRKAPRLGRWDAQVHARTSANDTALTVRVRGVVDSFFPLPPGQIDLQVQTGNEGSKVMLSLAGAKDFLIRAKLGNAFRPSQWRSDMKLDGTIDVQAWKMNLAHHAIPLDAKIDVHRLDRKGSEVTLHMRSGSTIKGAATFVPLTWKLDADIAPKEPWATVWLPGLAIDSGAHILGKDSGNGTAFEVSAYAPNWWKITQDSIRVRLWLNTKHLIFERIHAQEGNRHLVGSGEVSWTDWFWRFDASPIDDSLSYAEVHGNILTGDIQAQVGDFPLEYLPFAEIRKKLPFPAKVSGGFVHRIEAGSSFEWASGRLRSKPTEDSLTALFDFTRLDSSLQLRNLRVNFGSDRLRTSLEGRLKDGLFQLDTLALDLDTIHLERVMRLIDPNSQAGGVLKGNFRSGPSAGLTAQARLEGGWLKSEEGNVQLLPTLLIWGKRDTLNIGGYWPFQERKIPFKASISHLFDARRNFDLIAFPGDVLRVRANGFVDSLKRAEMKFDLLGEYSLESNGLLQRLSAKGEAKAWKLGNAWKWSGALASDSGGRYLAPEGNTFALAFKAHATPEALVIDTASLWGHRGGSAQFRARYDLIRSKLTMDGHVDRLQLGVGANRNLSIGVADITSTEEGVLHINMSNASFQERYAAGEYMRANIRDAQLQFQSAKDWNRLAGNIQVASAKYSRSVAAPSEFFRSTSARASEAATTRSSGKPLLLNLSVSSIGDSILLANNLARARLSFNIDVNGPTTSPLLNGFVQTSDSVSSFQYFGKVFQVDQFRLDWTGQSMVQGKYQLSGTRQIRHSCYDETQAEAASQEMCSIVLTSAGTLAHPQMQPLEAKTCAKDATAQATLQALALGCYPQSQNGQGIQFGNAFYAVGMGITRTWVNDVINGRLQGRRDPGFSFLPDSVMFKELPKENAGIQDRMVVAVGKKLSDRFDIEAEYSHVFTARADATSTSTLTSASGTGNSTAAATDDYTLRLRFHPPFHWVDDSVARIRLEERVLLQVEIRQSKGWIPGKETLLKPSIRYRWEFW